MRKKTIAEIAIEEMRKEGVNYIYGGMHILLDEIYSKFGGKVQHPLRRHKAVLDALRRSKLFKHDGYVRFCDRNGAREILRPRFRIADKLENQLNGR